LQINKNSISSRHTDKNNEGLSLIILLGDFSGGSFVTEGWKLTKDEVGTIAVIDGRKPHWSTPFKGMRFSIIAFLHQSTAHLTEQERKYLHTLGFRLPPEMEVMGEVQEEEPKKRKTMVNCTSCGTLVPQLETRSCSQCGKLNCSNCTSCKHCKDTQEREEPYSIAEQVRAARKKIKKLARPKFVTNIKFKDKLQRLRQLREDLVPTKEQQVTTNPTDADRVEGTGEVEAAQEEKRDIPSPEEDSQIGNTPSSLSDLLRNHEEENPKGKKARQPDPKADGMSTPVTPKVSSDKKYSLVCG
jgi:hypothetical protein